MDDVPYPTDDAQFNTQYNFPDQGLTWNLGQVVRLRLERAGPILLWKGTLSAGEGSQFGNRSVGYTLRFQSGTGGPFGELIPDPNVDPSDFEYRGQAIEIAYIFEAKRGAGALWTQLSNAHQLAGGVVDLVVGEEPNERRFSWTIADTVAGNGISGFVATTGQPQSVDDWTRLNWADGQQIPMRLELATEPDSRPEPPGESGPGICDRSLVVQNAILSQFETNPEYADITDCADVTAEHLEIIQEIDLSGLGLSELMEHDFWDLVHLESLDLSHNSLTLPPNFGIETRPDGEEHEVVGVVLNLRILNISNNDLQEPPLLLGTNLEELDLSHNPALGGDPSNQATPPLLLSDHADLRILNLTNTGLTETPDLNGLVKLEEVYLDGNRLTAVPSVEAMKSHTELRVLHLNDNQITGTMPNVVGNTKLEDLRLQNNRLSGTNGLGSNGALKTLYLHDNEFTSAPNFIQDISTLVDVRMQNNRLTSFPALISTNLQTLLLNNNRLTTAPSVSANTALTTLRLDDNMLTAAPDVSANTALLYLSLSNNRLTSVPSLSANVELLELNVSGNLLTATPDVSGNTGLVILALSGNQMTGAPDLSGHMSLATLLLDDNRLTGLTLGATAALQTLHLNNNLLTTLPSVSNHPRLTVFSVYKTR